MLPDRVQRRDVCAALQQRVHGRPFVLERQLCCRHGHERRCTARQQYDERLARIGATCDLQRAAARRHAPLVRQRMTRRNPLELLRQLDGEMRADDDAVANVVACDFRERVGHKRRGFTDGDDAQSLAVQTRGDFGILHGTID